MHRRHGTTATIVTAAAIAVMAVLAPGAMASKSQLSIIEDSGRILSPDPAQRDAALDETKQLGAQIIKIPVTWRSYAPDGTFTTKPSGDLSDPSTYPAGTWDQLDHVVSGADARGLKVWLMITAPAPRWAETKETGKYVGNYQPSVTDYADFVKAVGTRYPSVHYFSFWNEVNIMRFMAPQTQSGAVKSAIHYRDMYRAAYSAIRQSGHTGDTITFGELMPRSQVNDPNTTRPIAWLRAFFCLDKKGKALKGSAARKQKCSGFKKISASGIAYHPYRLTGGPLSKETSPDNAPIGNLNRVEKVLDQAYKAKRLANRRLKIYNTEFGFQTNPPDSIGKSLSTVASYLNTSEYISWLDARVASYSQYLLIDDSDMSGFQSGLRFEDGTIKAPVYAAYVTPLMVFKTRSANRVSVWGALRGKSGSTTAELQVRNGSDWTKVKSISVGGGSIGYFSTSYAATGAAKKSYRISWSGGESRTAKPVAPVKARTD